MKLLNKIKKFLNRKAKMDFDVIESNTLLINDHLNLVHRGARICVGLGPLDDHEMVLKNVEKVIARGHESVLEHSNVVLFLTVSNTKRNIESLLGIVETFKFLNYKIKKDEENMYILLGGSIRGFKHIIRNIEDPSNTILGYIISELYLSTYDVFFVDLINDGIMNRSDFVYERDVNLKTIYEEDNEVAEVNTEIESKIEEYNKFDIINFDNLQELYDKVEPYGFEINDILDMCTVTVRFKNISRAISQQMTRHRVGISQESQRYVDYSDMKFVDPTQFKEKYIMEKKYDINFETPEGVHSSRMTTKELSDSLLKVYPQLRDQGMDKEDARGFSLFNLETQLIMTFTLRQLFHFLSLRIENAAQAEIREIADELEACVIGKTYGVIGDIYRYLKPRYKLAEEANFNNEEYIEPIDEIIEEVVEIEEEENDVDNTDLEKEMEERDEKK